MADNDPFSVRLGFHSEAPQGEVPLSLVGVRGHEEISRLFELELLFFRARAALTDEQLDGLIAEPCVVALGTGAADAIHGGLSAIEHVSGTPDRGHVYRATMVPHVAQLTIAERSAIYQDTSVPDLIRTILRSYGLEEGDDFVVLLNHQDKSPKHEYVVQYQESDWDFIQRWLEHEGFFYWFTHTDGVKLVIADDNADATAIASPETLSFRERNNLLAGEAASVWSFYATRTRVAKTVTLVDYNHRRPRDLLVARQPVEKGTFGNAFLYGDHFKDMDVGKALAKVRAEELAAAHYVVKGVTDCERMRVGHTFELENHYHADYDGKYLVTSTDFLVGVDPRLSAEQLATEGLRQVGYQSTFTAIPHQVPFRPRRRAPWPSIHGVMHAHVEADTSGDYAQIDGQGRYKLKLPFDVGASHGTASSRWVRMAQPSAGAGYGSHHPLRKGTEVLVAHIDGDPDRPVILSAVPNAATPGPVVDANASQSVVRTPSGIRVIMEDDQR
jgi:type VI secretion system secreted protein VgrG